MNWQVYMIRCSDGTLYTGITTDIERRMCQHASGRGAKYFRGREPRELIYLESGHDRSSAARRDLFIKGLRRADKEALIVQSLPLTASPPPLPSPGRGEGDM